MVVVFGKQNYVQKKLKQILKRRQLLLAGKPEGLQKGLSSKYIILHNSEQYLHIRMIYNIEYCSNKIF